MAGPSWTSRYRVTAGNLCPQWRLLPQHRLRPRDQHVARAAAVHINIADLGQAPQDGFTEYQGYPVLPSNPGRARGDCSNAIFPGGKVHFSTNYTQGHEMRDNRTRQQIVLL
jgi:hypothetical protein